MYVRVMTVRVVPMMSMDLAVAWHRVAQQIVSSPLPVVPVSTVSSELATALWNILERIFAVACTGGGLGGSQGLT